MSKVIGNIKNYIKQNAELFRIYVNFDLDKGREIGTGLSTQLQYDSKDIRKIFDDYVVFTYDNSLPRDEVVGKGKLRSLLPTALKRVYEEGGI
jgi:hypothetical protein